MNFDKRLAFRGIRALYGNDGFEKLQSSHVTVIGVGGIGSWATEALCRTAIGSLTLIDNDTIELTNSNRQLHTTSNTLPSPLMTPTTPPRHTPHSKPPPPLLV